MIAARSVDSNKPCKLVLDISCRINGRVYKNVVEKQRIYLYQFFLP